MNQFDVAIIGAGPGGSAAAFALSRKGYSVALLDKERFPREKLCGDFVNPANWPLFRKLGLEEQILAADHEKVTTFRISSFSGAAAEVPLVSRNGQAVFGLGLRRASLDNLMLKKADSEGVSVWQGCRVIGLNREARQWSLAVERGRNIAEVHARALIGADGRNSWVAHRLGMTRGPGAAETAVAFQAHLENVRDVRDSIEIHLFPGGYAGLVRVDRNSINLCFTVERNGLPKPASLDSLLPLLNVNSRLRKILQRSRIQGEVRSTFPVYFPPRRRYHDSMLLVGDAAQVTEPVTGEGIYFALKSGTLAASSIDQAFQRSDFSADHLRSYELNCRRAFRLRRSINSLIRLLIYHPALLSPLIRFSARRARILDSIVHTICQPKAAG